MPFRSIGCYRGKAMAVTEAAGETGFSSVRYPADIDMFVFGHFHHTDIYRPKNKAEPALLSVGGWITEGISEWKGVNTFAVFRNDHVDIMEVTDTECVGVRVSRLRTKPVPSNLRHSLNRIALFLFSVYVPITVEGVENVPKTGAFILVSNHISALDPVVIELTCPRQIGIITKAEALRNPFIRLLVHIYSAIPIDRGKLDLGTTRTALTVLGKGTPIMITPEGTRSVDGHMQAFKAGFLKLAYLAKVPIVPVGISGTSKCFQKRSSSPGLSRLPSGMVVRIPPFWKRPTGWALTPSMGMLRRFGSWCRKMLVPSDATSNRRIKQALTTGMASTSSARCLLDSSYGILPLLTFCMLERSIPMDRSRLGKSADKAVGGSR